MMMRKLTVLLGALFAGIFGGSTMAAPPTLPQGLDPENTLILELKDGNVIIEMYPQDAPRHVARIKELVRQKFYDGLTFHRVIPGFMAQTGDPAGDGTGGSGQNLPAEFNERLHLRGTVSMARAEDPDSADSQFFICFRPAFHLNGQYTVWGRVVAGMDAVDKIKPGEGMAFVHQGDPDKIISLRVAADVMGTEAAQ
jgi:peptidylprolyl isomerase